MADASMLNLYSDSQGASLDHNKWQRFHKDFPAVENCDKSNISAKFENGVLHVKQPKLITSAAVKRDKELPAAEAESTPAKRHKTSLRDEFTKQDNADNTPAKEPAKEERNYTSTKTNEQTEIKNLPEKSSTDKSSSSSSYSESTDDVTDDETTRNSSCLAANLKEPRRMMKMTLVALLVLGISFYICCQHDEVCERS
nr:uncharacterized protein LOC104118527 [Nicotiana tomentosiformis]